jgi:5-methylcytosine-specific restriction protein B
VVEEAESAVEPKIPIEQALAEWDRDQARPHAEAGEQERQEVLKRFPLEDWATLPLNRYALGVEEGDSFCWWMEFGTPHIGSIRGGSAKKHLIYRKSDGSGWYYVDRNRYPNVDAAWDAVRAGFVQAFDLAREGRWAEIGDIYPLSSANTLSGKALFSYFPDDLIPIFAHQAQEHFYRLLGGTGTIPSGAPGSRRLFEIAQQQPGFDGWSSTEIERFLYDWANPREAHRIVKVAPGEDAKYWDDCRTNGYICVGWDEVGDLREFSSKDEFRARFGETTTYTTEAKTTAKANELWTLIELEPGDIVIANKGTSRVLAVGTVIDPAYEWRPERTEFKHTVRIEWDESKARDIETIKSWGTVTVAKVPNAVYDRILRGFPDRGRTTGVPGPSTFPPDPIFEDVAEALDRKGQVILYGPPGTGKTYTASRFAVWWLRNLADAPDAGMVLGDPVVFQRAERDLTTAQLERRVWWVVANPAEWSWDRLFTEKTVDYRYGRLQKNYASLQPGDLVVGYQANPDKRIVAVARVSAGLHPVDGQPKISLEPLAQVPNGPTYDELTKDPVLSASEPIRNRNQGTLFALTGDEAAYVVSLLRERNPGLPELEQGESEVGPLTRVTFHPSYTYEDFVEGYRPVETTTGQLQLKLSDGIFKRVCRQALARPDQIYLLIIDEINRGNIPKIFGELITLLEMDKRGFTVLLPQSREPFQVPKNVRVIGTMNTADRSIKTLDAALRRRFAFIELMPDQEPLAGGLVDGLDLWVFLDGLNQRIAERVGREKQIGHSFLLRGSEPISEPDEFGRRFRTDILPLLQEYAYEDYGQLADFIGADLVDAKLQRLNQNKLEDPSELIAALKDHFQPKSDIDLQG